MIVDGGVPELHETSYDLDAAVDELRAPGFVKVDEHLGASLLDPVDPDWLAAFLEHRAGRGMSRASRAAVAPTWSPTDTRGPRLLGAR